MLAAARGAGPNQIVTLAPFPFSRYAGHSFITPLLSNGSGFSCGATAPAGFLLLVELAHCCHIGSVNSNVVANGSFSPVASCRRVSRCRMER
jgi:hypothetical protein